MHKIQPVIVIVGTLLIADFILFGYLPSKRRLMALERSRTEQENAVAQAVEESSQLAALRHSINEERQWLTHQQDRIPHQRDLGNFLHTVVSLMQKHTLEEHSIEPQEDVFGDHPPCIPMNLRCRGSYEQLYLFCRDLQSLPRLVRFEEVLFQRHPSMTGDVMMNASIAIFYQPDTELIPSPVKGSMTS